MIYEPHDYQKYAINFIKENPIAAVLLDMGLGKTSITLTAINDLLFDSFDVRKVLVIAPLRVARDTWTAEVDKWDHLRHLICSVAVGTEAERKAALRKKAHIYIINRENVSWLIEESGIPFDFDMVVIDELSSFKNGKAKRFKSLLKVRPLVKRIVGLTGTPAGNGLMDLWAEFRVLDMGKRLGRFISNYRLNYFTPDKRNGQIVYSYKPLPFAEQSIYDAISDITISMKSTDHLKMPELVSTAYPAVMSDAETRTYEDFKSEYVMKLGKDKEITAANAAVLCGKLTQMANGAIYDESGEYKDFIDGYSYGEIADRLIADEVPTRMPGASWAKTTVQHIIRNEKYCGDCLFQKAFIANPITHQQVRNNGELPKYLVEDCLPAIVDKETWKLAQAVAARHTPHRQAPNERYPFTGKLFCGICGKPYYYYHYTTTNKQLLAAYRCMSRKTQSAVEVPGQTYTPPHKATFNRNASAKLIAYRERYCKPPKERPMLCTDVRIPTDLPQKAFCRAWNLIVAKKLRYQATLRSTVDNAEDILVRYRAEEMCLLIDEIGKINEFSYPLMLKTLDRVVVNANGKLIFIFQSGIKITV